MITKDIMTKEHIKAVNEKYGGSLRTDAEIETALNMGKGRSVFRKVAYLWRSILVGHPFTDGNKRTALMTAMVVFDRSGLEVQEDRKEAFVSEITRIARENIRDINRIERLVRYAAKGH